PSGDWPAPALGAHSTHPPAASCDRTRVSDVHRPNTKRIGAPLLRRHSQRACSTGVLCRLLRHGTLGVSFFVFTWRSIIHPRSNVDPPPSHSYVFGSVRHWILNTGFQATSHRCSSGSWKYPA